jgi:hypothetical protein
VDKKKGRVRLMSKRNKRTNIMAHVELAPLTESILAQMGQEGATLRERLTLFYRRRTCKDQWLDEKFPDNSS